MNFTTFKKAKIRKGASNFVAVLTALSLVFLQTPIAYADDPSPADAGSGASATLSDQAVENATVDVGLSFDHAYIEYDGQVVAEPATKVTVPTDSDFTFTAVADEGYEISAVEATIGDSTEELSGDGDEYTLSADDIANGDASVAVLATPAEDEADEPEAGADDQSAEGEAAEGEEGAEASDAAADATEPAEGESGSADAAATDETASAESPEAAEGETASEGSGEAAPADPASAEAQGAEATTESTDAAAQDLQAADQAASDQAASDQAAQPEEQAAASTEKQSEVDEAAEAQTTRKVAAKTKARKLAMTTQAVDDAVYSTYNVNIKFYDMDKTTETAFDPENGDRDNYYVVAWITPKQGENKDEVQAWAVKQVNLIGKKQESVTLSKSDFAKYDRTNQWNPTYLSGNFDLSQEDVHVRLYHNDWFNYYNMGDEWFNPKDYISGYDIKASTTNNNTNINISRAYQKPYVVQFEFDGESDGFDPADNYYLFVDVDHHSTGHTYYLEKLDMSGVGTQEIEVTTWFNGDGQEKAGERVTGNERSVTARIIKSSVDNLSYNNASRNNNFVAIGEGQTSNGYFISYEDMTVEGSDDDQTSKFVSKIKLTPVRATNDYNFKSVLGAGLYYGITANVFSQQNDIQSNFATNEYISSGQQFNADLSGESSGAVIIGSLSPNGSQNIHIGNGTVGSIAVYLGAPSATKSKVSDDSGKAALIESTTEELQNNYVTPIIDYGKAMSEELAAHEANYVPAIPQNGKLFLDTTDYPDDATIYIDADPISSKIAEGGGLCIKKKLNQVLVFNFDETTSQTFSEYYVNYGDEYVNTATDTRQDDGNYYKKSNSPMTRGDAHNDEIDKIARTIVWNCASLKTVNINIGTGMFLMPREDSDTTVTSTSSGWIISAGKFTNTGGEWHSVYSELPKTDVATLHAAKTVDSKTPKGSQVFEFAIDRYNAATGQWENLANVENEGAAIAYTDNSLADGWNVYRITETAKAESTPGNYNLSTTAFYAEVLYETISGSGNSAIKVARTPQYYSSFNESTGRATGAKVSTPTFANTTKTTTREAHGSVTFDANKTYSGGTLEADQFTFYLKDAQGNVLQTKTNDANGHVAFDTINYDLDDAGKAFTYTISEAVPDGTTNNGDGTFTKDNVTYDGHVVTKTVTVTDQNTEELDIAVETAGGTTTFANAYTYDATGSVKLEASKTYTGGADLAEGQFSFKLKNEQGTELQTKANDANGKVSFDAIEYGLADAGKTFNYTIAEVIPAGVTDNGNGTFTKDGVTYDGHEAEVSVAVSDNGDGTLKCEPTYVGGKAAFSNSYEATGSVALQATKHLEGATLAKDAFTFELLDADGTVIQTAKNAADGTVSFSDITYKKKGTYTYTIREQIPPTAKNAGGETYGTSGAEGPWKLDGVTYDGHEAEVTVTVADDGKGNLTATPNYSNDAPAYFENTYDAKTKLAFEGVKTISGRQFQEGDAYTFTIVATGDNAAAAPLPKESERSVTIEPTSGTTETFSFGNISYTLADAGATYTYKVVESATVKGVANDTREHAITVSVRDDGKGHLTATPVYSGAGLTFANTYNASGKAKISGTKTLEGASLADYAFRFQLKGADGNVIQTVSSDAEGAFAFDDIPYTLDKLSKVNGEGRAYDDFTYTVVELNDAKDGITYDNAVKTVNVHVEDAGDGTLAVTYGEGGNTATFKNTYKATGAANLSAVKTLDGRSLAAGEFTFELSGDGIEAQQVENDQTGKALFAPISYSVSDLTDTDANGKRCADFAYTIREVIPADAEQVNGAYVKNGVTYDEEAEKTVNVHVVDNGDGTLGVTYDGAAEYAGAAFENTYDAAGTATIRGSKGLTHKDIKSGAFAFTMEGGNLEHPVTAIAKADGTIEFPTVNYALSDLTKVGENGRAFDTFTYTIREVLPKDENGNAVTTKDGVIYDTHYETVTVTVADNGVGQLTVDVAYDDDGFKFENGYEATSDSISLLASKTLNGEAPGEGAPSFSFTLDGDGLDAPVTAVADTEGNAYFAGIVYEIEDLDGKASKTFNYTIRENIPEGATENEDGTYTLAGYTYDGHEAKVAVTVTDNGDGTLSADVTSDENAPTTFANSYEATGSVSLVATKKLEGAELEEGAYTFELRDADGNLVESKPNAADGLVSFAPIAYSLDDAGKTFTYTIKEVVPAEANAQNGFTFEGVTYDTHSETVTVKVEDAGNGRLTAVATYDADRAVFANTYDATGTTSISGKKTIEGRDFHEGDKFAFEIAATGENAAKAPLPNPASIEIAPTSGTEADFSFGEISYGLADAGETYTYIVTEKATIQGVANDTATHEVVVKVEDTGKGTLSVERTYSDGDNLAFANTYDASGSVVLSATKELDSVSGRALADSQFAFQLKDESGKVLQQKGNKADGTITFDAIPYTLADAGKTFTYTINEVKGNAEGYSYDEAVKTATVVVSDNADGTLGADVTYAENNNHFRNTYEATGEAEITGTKTLVNREFHAGDVLTFSLSGSLGAPMPDTTEVTVSPTGGTSVAFALPKITYSLADANKTYLYTVNETATLDGVNNDAEGHAVLVKVGADDGTGHLSTEVVYTDEASATFTNTYAASGEVTLTAEKALDKKDLEEGMFNFELVDENGDVVREASNDAEGKVTFAPIGYSLSDAGKQYGYTIREVMPEGATAQNNYTVDGITYDATQQPVTVTIAEDDGSGVLDIDVAYGDGGKASIANAYEAHGEATIEATKTLTGRDLEANQFSFELKDSNGNVLQTAYNDADGKIAFAPIEYVLADAGKNYTYWISEVVPGGQAKQGGYTYDTTEQKVTVAVSEDDGAGNLTTEVTYGGGSASFTNAYEATGKVALVASKTLSGRTLADGQFTFELRDAAGEVIDTKTCDASGAVAFDEITYTKKGTYNYTINERVGNAAGYTYDGRTVNVTVEVTDNGNGTLSAVETYEGGAAAFANTYVATGSVKLAGTKTISGRTFQDGDAFTFTLQPVGMAPVPTNPQVTIFPTAGTSADFSFDAISYTLADVGKTYEYKVIETANLGGVANDADVHTVTVSVSDPGTGKLAVTPTYSDGTKLEFKNSYDADGRATISGTKTLRHARTANHAFRFELVDQAGKVLQTVTSNEEGLFQFAPIEYKLAQLTKHNEAGMAYDDFAYTVREVNDGLAGIAYDTSVKTVNVRVVDGGAGKLLVTYGESGNTVNFTNTYKATATAQLFATKTLNGQVPDAEAFSFTLSGSGIETQTAANDETGKATFAPITYKMDDLRLTDENGMAYGEFTYTISEVVPADAVRNDVGVPVKDGMAYDANPRTVNVRVTDNGDGTLSVAYDGAATFEGAAFANTYTASGSVDLDVSKSLTGKRLTAGAYEFLLQNAEGEGIEVAKNAADGTVTFGSLDYTLDELHQTNAQGRAYDTFKYTIREVPGTGEDGRATTKLDGVTYDTHVESVVVTVTDNGNGTLSAVAAYDEDGAVFANRYDASGEIALSASKTLDGKAPGAEASRFTFSLAGDGIDTAIVATSAEDGTVSFAPIKYKLADLGGEESATFNYTIRENIPAGATRNDNGTYTLAGYTYDGHTADVAVTVTDNGDGTLSAEADVEEGATAFANTYRAVGEAAFTASKTLNGQAAEAGAFKFQLFNAQGKLLQTKENGEGGLVSFDPISYEAAGDYTYTIREVIPEGAVERGGNYLFEGTTYDGHADQIDVEVTDNGNGTLTSKVSYDVTGATFANTYEATGTTNLYGTKTLAGRNFHEGDSFRFQVTPVGENAATAPLPERKAILVEPTEGSIATINFGNIAFDLDDAGKTYTYQITESGSGTGVTNDSATHTATVKVTDNGDGTLNVERTYTDGTLFAFTNTYDATGQVVLDAAKTLENATLTAGAFTFRLTGDGIDEPQVRTNDAEGHVAFAPIKYALSDVGKTFTYRISEVNDGKAGVTYDETVKTATVKVADNGDGTLKAEASYTNDNKSFTNTYAASGSTEIKGTKTLTGRSFMAGDEITFTLSADEGAPMPATTEVTIKPTAGTEAPFSFGSVEYSLDNAGATYVYTITEQATMGGTTNDAKTHTVAVEVGEDNGTGKLSVTPRYSDGIAASFVNAYDASGKTTVQATKVLENRDLAADMFTFELVDNTGEVVDTAKNTADGSVTFAELNFGLADAGKTFNYTIREVIPKGAKVGADGISRLNGIAYDGHEEAVRVAVAADKGTGTLDVTPLYDESGAVFTNTYTAEGSATLYAHKALEGRDLAADQFAFALMEGDSEIATATNQADGTIAFAPIAYTLEDAGTTHTYKIREIVPDAASAVGGYTYADNIATATVEVLADQGTGVLATSVNYEGGEASFTNNYKATGEVVLKATKKLTGRALADGQFTFRLADSAGKMLQEKANGAGGVVTFDPIAYDKAGTYTYTISEVNDKQAGYGYDDSVVGVTVDVTDNGDGTLTATETYDGGAAVFTNTYDASGSIVLEGAKTIEGRSFAAGDNYTFTISGSTGAPMPAVPSVTIEPTKGTSADFEFGKIDYKLADAGKTYTYTVTESADIAGVTNDSKTHTVEVAVTDNGDGTLSATPTYSDGDALAFANAYAAAGAFELGGTKTLTGRAFAANDKFTFAVEGSEGAPMPETTEVTIEPVAGQVAPFSFGDIDYKLADAGKTYTYTVTESADIAGVTNDSKTHTVEVAVTDNGDGTLAIAPTYSDGDALAFENAYAATGKAELFAAKTLEGRTQHVGEFSFELAGKGIKTQVVKNANDGRVAFEPISYTLADVGEHVYTIREVEGELGGVAYDETVYTVRVNVSDAGDGTLDVTYNGADTYAGANFTNVYTTQGSVVLHAEKRLAGIPLADGLFTFELVEDGGVIQTAPNKRDGSVDFAPITYSKPGTHYYTVREANSGLPGFTYDDHETKVSVEVVDNEDGTMTATPAYEGGAVPVFENAYGAEGTFTIDAKKLLNGRSFKAGDSFTFVLEAPAGTPMPANAENNRKQVTIEPTEGNEATIDFGAIDYKLEDANKSYTYTVREVHPTDADGKELKEKDGVAYAEFAHTVAVAITDAGDGTLNIAPEYSDGESMVLTNTYTATGAAHLFATKTLEGRALAANEFFFTLTGDGIPEGGLHAGADANGRAAFEPINYTLADAGKDFHYTITEDKGALPGVTYDESSHDVTVHVEDAGNGTLAITYDGADTYAGAAFANKYEASGTAQLYATKNLVTREGITWPFNAGDFQFTLSENGEVLQTVANDESGKATFEPIGYTLADVGRHTYEIAEVAGSLPDVTYDTAAHTVVVDVADTGRGVLSVAYDGAETFGGAAFTNTFKRSVKKSFEFDKHFYGGTDTFDFTLAAANADGSLRAGDAAAYKTGDTIVDNGTAPFTISVKNGPYTDGVAKVVFPEIAYEQPDGEYYYLVSEDAASTDDMTADEASFLVHVTVKDYAITGTTYELIYDGENLGATDDLAFYNNETVSFGFQSLAMTGQMGALKRVSVYPHAQKYLNGTTDLLSGGEFTFELVDAESGKTIATATNDAEGEVAFFDEETELGLVFTEPDPDNPHRYIIREVAGNSAGITYDDSEITLDVTVDQNDDGSLVASESYNGPGGTEPAFYNTREGIDVKVQKVSRFGGEGLEGSVYGLWMVGESGDVLVQEATSDAEGYITFTDVNLIAGQKYYFKEVAAPAGHTVDPYRTAYFTLNAAGDGLELIEKTADDGWHSAIDSNELENEGAMKDN